MALGRKTGGRQKGTPNRATLVAREMVAEALAGGPTPLEFLIETMRGEREPTPMQLQAATVALAYVHPRLSAMSLDVQQEAGPIVIITGVPEAESINEWAQNPILR
jgi:hypothetical protein